MNTPLFRSIPLLFAPLLVALIASSVHSQETSKVNPSTSKPPSDTPLSVDQAMELLKPDVGTWNAHVSLWLRPGTPPIQCQAVVTSKMAVGGKYFEQQFEGTFGPELGNKSWSSHSFTGYNTSLGMYEAVRMASSDTPMIIVRGKSALKNSSGTLVELRGEYSLMGKPATERDVIRRESRDRCVIESWMSFDGSEEFKGSEMVLTRIETKTSQPVQADKDQGIRLGNFSMSLAVKDLAKSRAFYESIGFHKVAGQEGGYWIMQNDASTIGLFQGMLTKNLLTYNPGWDRNCATLPEFDDVREIQKMLQARGIALDTTADESSTGPASVMLHDPDGNQILIDQHVDRP